MFVQEPRGVPESGSLRNPDAGNVCYLSEERRFIDTVRDQLLERLLDRIFVLLVSHSEPLIIGLQDGDIRLPGLQKVIHDRGKKVLRGERLILRLPEKYREPFPEILEELFAEVQGTLS